MKFLIVLSFLFAVACAKPYEVFLQSELGYPLKDYFAYMQCAPTQIDQLVEEYDCKSDWDVFRDDYISTIANFEGCAELDTENESDACRYTQFAASERVLSYFYWQLKTTHDLCHRVIPQYVKSQCQSDEMNHAPDF